MTVTISREASFLVRRLADGQHRPGHAGLRITTLGGTNGSLVMELSDRPMPDEVVVAGFDALMFLSPSAATRLDGGMLDADVTPAGPRFHVRRGP